MKFYLTFITIINSQY